MKRLGIAFLIFFVSAYLTVTSAYAEPLDRSDISNASLATINGKDADRVHLRAQPSINATSLGLYFSGTEVLCEKSTPEEEWTKVVIGAQTGYIKSEYLCWGEDRENVLPKQPRGTIRADGWVNVRSAPSKESSIDGKLHHGDDVTILGETSSHWYYIRATNTTGYAMARYVSLQESRAHVRLLGAAHEISFEFDGLVFHYGDSYSDIMKKSSEAGYVFERLGNQGIYYYGVYDEVNSVWSDIGIGFDDDQHIDYVDLKGDGTINGLITYPITFAELAHKLGEEAAPQIFVAEGKVDTVCYLWTCDSYCIQAMAWPLSANDIDNLDVDSIEVYSNQREPVKQIP